MEALLVLGGLGLLAAVAAPHLPRHARPVRLVIIAFSVVAIARYLFWRFTSTLPPIAFSLESIVTRLFLVLEVVVFIDVLVELFMLRRTINRSKQVDQTLNWYGVIAPRVDIFIPTYDESWEVLEKTVVGAIHQDYPNFHVWILDDGRRAWLRDRAEASAFGYISRDSNRHYKAGNLNHAVAELRAQGITLEFIAVLDADFIGRPDFVRRTLALMKTNDVGLVQTPQVFYNEDPFQRAYGGIQNWPDEQRAWFDVQLPCLDAVGAATCCGTSFLLRSTALDSIGGFPNESIVEDNLTSQKLEKNGWKTVFLGERLSVGMAPENLGEFLKQRARWLHGQVQNLRCVGAPPGIGGRISYLCRLWRRANFALERLSWVFFAILFWCTGIWFLRVESPIEVLGYFAPLWLARLFQGWAYGGRQTVFISDAHWMLLAPLYIKENIRAVLGRPVRFDVTEKGVRIESWTLEWSHVRFQLVLAFLLVASVVFALATPNSAAHGSRMLALQAGVTAYALLLIWAAVAPAIQAPRRRRFDRYGSMEQVIAVADGVAKTWCCENISLGGMLVHTGKGSRVPPAVEVHLAHVRPMRARLIRRGPNGLAAFAFESPEGRIGLIRKLYCSEGYLPAPERWSPTVALTSALKYLGTLLLIPFRRGARSTRRIPALTGTARPDRRCVERRDEAQTMEVSLNKSK